LVIVGGGLAVLQAPMFDGLVSVLDLAMRLGMALVANVLFGSWLCGNARRPIIGDWICVSLRHSASAGLISGFLEFWQFWGRSSPRNGYMSRYDVISG
jgi:hypothetical protein